MEEQKAQAYWQENIRTIMQQTRVRSSKPAVRLLKPHKASPMILTGVGK